MSLVKELLIKMWDTEDRVRKIRDEIEYIKAHCPHEHARKERDDDYHRPRWIYICQGCELVSTVPIGKS
jgi:hypothetical protein